LIEIEEKEKTEQFLKYFDEIRSIEDDEDLHNGFVTKLVSKAMKKYVAESRDKVIYYSTCKLVQLFEFFLGFIVIKATKVIEFVPVVNVTKDVNLKISIREVKFVNDHRYMFKPVGVEVFVYNSNESYLLVFNDKNARDTVKEILTSNAPKILEMHLDVITKMWMNGYLANYDYLIYLNRFSSRSFNDISQYPVFPWIVNEFSDDGRLLSARIQVKLQKLL
jgi:factor associated with neutral sphingomyelinase activation